MRAGAHRVPRAGGRWSWLLTAIIACVVLSGLGILVLVLSTAANRVGVEPPPSATAIPTAEPTIDPSPRIRVLNGTSTPGLATTAVETLASAGWSQTITALLSDDTDTEFTTVFYADPGLEGAARGVAESLGGGVIQLTDSLAEEGEGRPADGSSVAPEPAEEAPALVVVIGVDFASRIERSP